MPCLDACAGIYWHLSRLGHCGAGPSVGCDIPQAYVEFSYLVTKSSTNLQKKFFCVCEL